MVRLALIPRLILHNQPALTKFGRYEQYTINIVVCLIGNEADRWYICFETRLHGQQTIDERRFQARRHSCLITGELKRRRSRLSADEIAEFLTKTERKESKNTQNILLDEFYLLFEESARKT